MMRHHSGRYNFEQKRIIFVGNYGSGKTEVAVNTALTLRETGRSVAIADLDVVNPYFRCREAVDEMAAKGIRVVIPEGDRRYADLPIVMPEIKGMLQDDSEDAPFSVFDVGGDDVGALLLSAMRDSLGERSYALLQVINTNRPFTSTIEGCLEMKRKIETTARLRITGLVVNSHLMEETLPSTILEGYEIATAVSKQAGIPVAFVAAMGALADAAPLKRIDAPIMRLERKMAPPWRATADGIQSPGRRSRSPKEREHPSA